MNIINNWPSYLTPTLAIIATIIFCIAVLQLLVRSINRLNMSRRDKLQFAFAIQIGRWLYASCENLADLVSTLAFLFFVFRFVILTLIPGVSESVFILPTTIATLGILFIPELLLGKTLIDFRELLRLKDQSFWFWISAINAGSFTIITGFTTVQIIMNMFHASVFDWLSGAFLGFRIVAVVFFVISTRLFEAENGQGFGKKILQLNANLSSQAKDYQQQIERIQSELSAKLTALETQFSQERDEFMSIIAEQKRAIALQNSQISQAKDKELLLISEIEKDTDAALQAYGDDVINWINNAENSVTIEEIAAHLNKRVQTIEKLVTDGSLKKAQGRGKNRVLVDSLKEWMKENAPRKIRKSGERDTDSMPVLHLING